MDFQEFITIAREIGCVRYPDMEKRHNRYSYYGCIGSSPEQTAWNNRHPEKAFFEESWRTGGEQGGSCWDDGTEDHHCPINGDIEPPMTDLDELLLKVAPNISFLVYRNLENKLLERDERCENEYYGNYTNYGIKRINIKKLYDYLVEHGVF